MLFMLLSMEGVMTTDDADFLDAVLALVNANSAWTHDMKVSAFIGFVQTMLNSPTADEITSYVKRIV